jgi:arginine decarboxylase
LATWTSTLADITCDSDGRIDRFAGAEGPVGLLPLHPLTASDGTHEPYYLGVFLTGAYQETLGDLHNLLGDPHVAHVGLGPDGRWRIDAIVEGDTVREVLEYVEYDTAALRDTLRRDVEDAVGRGTLSVAEGTALRRLLSHSVQGYSYLD